MTGSRGPTAGDVARTPDELVDAVVRLMPDPAVVVDGAGRIVAANALSERQFGYGAGGLAGMQIEQLVPERLRTRHVDHRRSYTARPTQRPMGAGLSLWGVRRDGTEFPVDISLAPLGVPERPLTLAAIRDLTERRAEWETEARLAAVVSSSDDAIVSMDLTGTLTSWNPGAERLLGHEAAEMVGRSFWRLVPPGHRSEVEERMARIRAGMRVPTHDTKRLHRDGRQIDVAESMALIPGVSGEPAGFAAVLRDITERRRTEGELRDLLAESQRRERWLAAMSEVRLALFSGGEQERWLELVTQRVSELVDADGALVTLPDPDDPASLYVASMRGDGSMMAPGDKVPMDVSLAGRVFRTGQSLVSDHFRADSPAPAEILERVPIGPVILAPMSSSVGTAGVLLVTRLPEREPFGVEDTRLVESFAQQAGLGIELWRAQTQRAQFALVADRERIARDLHDHVIQRLFAVGMSLQAAANSIADQRALDRIEESVEELDATIRDVRSTIFSLELQATEHVETSARSRILDVASMAAPALGFQPRLQFDGPVDTRVPDEMVPDVLAVVREGLSNAARHAEATGVEVHVSVTDQLVIEVIDDGKGAGERTRSSGLANLRTRAENRGGTMEIGEGRKGRGTRVVWRVPLPELR
ncbi:MAG: sensor histidine kinase [Acidimicrobiales bacterium]